jgi:hypothetical protein
MWRKRGRSGGEKIRVVRNVAFPVVNRNGPGQLVSIHCRASLEKRGNPIIPFGPDEVISRHRGQELEENPLVTFFDTEPRIGHNIFVCGNSLDLAFVIVDRMARYGFSETRKIIATGCLLGNEGTVGMVDDFDRKLDLLLQSGLQDFLLIFPKENVTGSVQDKLQGLVDKQGAECKAIDNLDDAKFLWTVKPADRGMSKWIPAGILVMAATVCVVLAVPPLLSLLSTRSPGEQPPSPPEKSIWTSGEKGYYHTQLCPPLPPALASIRLPGYQCVPTRGTLDNIERVGAHPTSIGLAQLDVYADEEPRRAEEFKTLQVIRSDTVCEGLFLITKKSDVSLDRVREFARRVNVILPPKGSGSAASFRILQKYDPKGLGGVREVNIRYEADATAVINEVASSTDDAVGFIVQFAEPGNENIRLIMEKGLTVIPVVSPDILNVRPPGGQPVYKSETFTLKSGIFGVFATRVTTACTPVAMITGDPEALNDEVDRGNQMDLIRKLRQLPATTLVPQKNR